MIQINIKLNGEIKLVDIMSMNILLDQVEALDPLISSRIMSPLGKCCNLKNDICLTC